MNKKSLLHLRVYAFLVDIFTVKAVFIISIISFFRFLSKLDVNWTLADFIQVKAHTIVAFALIYSMYFTLSLFLSNGKTLGKFLFKIQVKTKGRERIDFTTCFLRSLTYLVMTLSSGFLLFVIPFCTKDQRGLPDYFSKSRVSTETDPLKTKAQVFELEFQSTESKDWPKELIS
ncbi:RDD family protein [bacterium]|nr:RDD family protein [bacterium]